MTVFRVDPDKLEELAGELRRRGERLAEGREVLAKAARGVAGKWSGGARDEFVAAHTRWDQDHRTRLEELAGAAAMAEEAAATYREVDRAVAEMFE
ncbi:WXG100 family type VII secretion target [Leifsonia aquatica]|uniref:WXG100 family type VII secretion target n=1 Tax=Leifsonia aquatica TaxID=144185 RepID=UPI0038223BB3